MKREDGGHLLKARSFILSVLTRWGPQVNMFESL